MDQDESDSDRDLDAVQKMQNEDTAGLVYLLRRHAPRVRGGLLAEFQNRSEADIDAAINQAAHRVWTSATSFQAQRGSLRAWFYVIARNCLRDSLRRDQRAEHHQSLEGLALEGSQFTSSPAGILASESSTGETIPLSTALRACVGQLPPLQRRVIEADLGSCDIADTQVLAEDLGTTTNSIRVSRSVARKSLRSCLERAGVSLSATPTAKSSCPSEQERG